LVRSYPRNTYDRVEVLITIPIRGQKSEDRYHE
jgi:hypothetical protein